MNVRQRTEEIERMTFAPWATFSDQSRGRMVQEEQDPIRPVFQRDRDRVLHCKAFRRLKQKTQVFLSPEGDLYRTRLTHTLEVSQIARTIARALRLNEDLTEAISLAHDLGHTPFGHAGEQALNELCPDGGQAGKGRKGPEPDMGGAQWHRDPHQGDVGGNAGGTHRAHG